MMRMVRSTEKGSCRFLLKRWIYGFLVLVAGGAWQVYGAVEWSLSPEGSEIRARSAKKDILYLYVSSQPGPAEKGWMQWLDSSRFDESGLDGSFVFCKLELPSGRVNPGSPVTSEVLGRAARHGVRMLPTMILCDEKGKPYAMAVGGSRNDDEADALAARLLLLHGEKVKRDEMLARAYAAQDPEEAASMVLLALEHVPVESWAFHYAACMHMLEKSSCADARYLEAVAASKRILHEEALGDLVHKFSLLVGEKEREDVLKGFLHFLEEKDLETPTRQCVLVAYVYPLLVNRCRELFRKIGSNSPELEETFNCSVEVLEEARDLDPASYWGRMAHETRENLRKARLAAARYD